MKTLVIATQKGGSSKTTLSAHLAVSAELDNCGPVVILDMDTQANLADWWNARAAETPAYSAAPKDVRALPVHLAAMAEKGFALAVIDTPPADNPEMLHVMELADLVVIPVKPSPNDLRAIGATLDMVKQSGKPFVFAITLAKAGTRLLPQAIALLSAHGQVSPAIMHDRIDYAACMADGRTIIEIEPHGRGAGEMAELWDFVKERMDESTIASNNEITKPRKKAVA